MTIEGLFMALLFVAFAIACVYLSLAIEGWQDRRAARRRNR